MKRLYIGVLLIVLLFVTGCGSATSTGDDIIYCEYEHTASANEGAIVDDTISFLIYDELHKMLSVFPEWDALTLEINYEIMFSSDRLLSIVYRGLGYVQGAARPVNLFSALNVNMETAERIVLSDVININEQFIDLLLSECTVHLNPHPELRDFVREVISMERFLLRLQNMDSVEVYFTFDSMGISIGGLGGAAGDHTELEVRYDIIKNKLCRSLP